MKAVGPDAAKLVTVPTESVGIRDPSASQIKPTASSRMWWVFLLGELSPQRKEKQRWPQRQQIGSKSYIVQFLPQRKKNQKLPQIEQTGSKSYILNLASYNFRRRKTRIRDCRRDNKSEVNLTS